MMEDEDCLGYDDDMDRMLDDELEILREIENDRNKENEPSSRRSLNFGGGPEPPEGEGEPDPTAGQQSLVSSNLKSHDTNVFNTGKRTRPTSEDSDSEMFPPLYDNDTTENSAAASLLHQPAAKTLTPQRSPRNTATPSAKRLRVDGDADAGNVLADIGNMSTMSDFSSQPRYRVPLMGERKIYRRVPLDSDSIAVTPQSGKRFYLRMKPAEALSLKAGIVSNLSAVGGKSLQPSGLCGVPFSRLQQQAEQEIEKLSTREKETYVDSGIESSDDDESSSQELWVEKFKPRSYMDLLSDVGTNRILLKWLKLWDKLVFGKEVKKVHTHKPDDQQQAAPKFQQMLPEVVEELDDLHRPVQHVALLHGPPGLGKTTLAHIVARHAGYNVVEMNASDDRSVDAFKKKLESSTQMRSVLTADQRPNCLIIDEIDGAPAPTINYLVSVLSGKQTAAGAAAKKKDKKKSTVLRPVICICNELYTPALRSLRQISLVVPFPPTSSTKLAERLKEIALKEKLSTDLTALLALCKKSDNDIRSCLSTLQFFNRRGRTFKASDVSSVSLGVKDTQKSLFGVWADIFGQPVKDAKASRHDQTADNASARMKHIQTSVARSGETDRILTGVFENYLTIPVRNVDLRNVVCGTEWFCYYDILHSEILHSQNYSIMGHLAYPLVKAHFLYSVPGRVKIMFPTQFTELRNKVNASKNILETITNEMLPATRAFCPNSVLVRELLPYILSVVQPVLRPINTQLYSAKEKSDLRNLVSIHIAYNITYQQERNSEGQYEYRMDPDVESIVAFTGVKRTVQLTYASKQLISHEIELEKMRRIDAMIARNAAADAAAASAAEVPPSATPTKPGGPSRSSQDPGSVSKSGTPQGSKTTTSHLQKLTPKQVVIKDQQAKDFFGRVIKRAQPKKSEGEKKNDIVKTDIWFKFKEGYSNAVRRNVKLKDFM
eukprot:TRINITY_DN2552_c0_g1_i1.p1 TRINITY_DN2552_c0_g1~~TRINITY_DN2552_c0_g1_i1.p1  ORF type:complete len:946 (-),score=309.66 TRINITY_DN2552_c0_g1_i1:176-3013(-)